jgi:hypothetical protein
VSNENQYRGLLDLPAADAGFDEEEEERKRKAALTPAIPPTTQREDPYRELLGLETSPMYQRRYGSPKMGEDDQRSLFETIANSDDPVEFINRINTSRYLAQTFGVEQDKAFANLDEISQYWMGKIVPPRTLFQNVRAAWQSGELNWEMGILAKQLKDKGGTDAAIEAKIAAIEQRMPVMENIPRPWLQNALIWTAQSAPAMLLSFAQGGTLGMMTGATAGLALNANPAGAIGAAATGGLSIPAITAAMASVGFVTGTTKANQDYTEGLSYLDMRKKGVPHSIAAPLSRLDALVQSTLETAQLTALLPKIPGIGQAFSGAASEAVKKLIMGGTLSTITGRMVLRMAGTGAEEGLEEGLQEISSILTEQAARELSKNQGIATQIPAAEWDAAFERVGQAMYQGFSAAIIMGTPNAVISIKWDIVQQQNLHQAARVIGNKETFVDVAEQASPKPEGVTGSDYREALGTIWEQEQTRRTAEAEKQAAPASPVQEARTPEGRLVAEETTLESTREGTMALLRVGNPKTQERYGYVRYEQTPERIYVEDLVSEQGDRSRDMILELAARNPGLEIQWDPTDEAGAALKEELIAQNPRGPEAGLQWFAEEETATEEQPGVEGPAPTALTQDIFRRQLVEGFGLKEEEATPFVVFNEILAKNEGIPVAQWLNKYFEPQAVERGGTLSKEVAAHGAIAATGFRVAGQAINPLDVDREEYKGRVRAVFAALEGADFHVATHEYFHAVERLALNKEQIAGFEQALGKLRQTWTDQDLETLADKFEDYLGTGRAPTEGLRKIFEQIAAMLTKLVSYIRERPMGKRTLSPSFIEAYDRIFQQPDSGLATAATTPTTPTATSEVQAPTQVQRQVQEDLFGETVSPEIAKPVTEAESVTSIDLSAVPAVDLPVGELTLSAEVPNFKEGASAEGVVEPISGERYERLGTAPIVVWERTDGRREVITGRHRLDLARRLGEQTIPAQVVREADGFTAAMAMMFDAEANIRDGQGSIKDYANYFRHSAISEEEASRRGLLGRDKGRKGFAIGRYASDGLYTLYRNGQIGEEKAAAIAAAAPNNDALQDAGILRAKELTAAELVNYLAILQKQTTGVLEAEQGDLFGRNESFMVAAEAVAKEATKKQAELRAEHAALRSALRLSKGEQAKVVERYGFKAGDTAGIQKRLVELEDEMLAWSNWTSSPEKQAELRDRAGMGKGSLELFGQAAEIPAGAEEAPVLSFEEYSLQEGVPSGAPSFPEAHRAPGGVSKQSAKAMQGRIMEASASWERDRDRVRAEYAAKVASGEIVEPDRITQLERTAEGEGEAAEAARRVLDRRRERVEGQASLFHTEAFHGTKVVFSSFDPSFMGTGEGAQAYGWGTYVAQEEGTARHYAEVIAASVKTTPQLHIKLAGKFDEIVGTETIAWAIGGLPQGVNSDTVQSWARTSKAFLLERLTVHRDRMQAIEDTWIRLDKEYAQGLHGEVKEMPVDLAERWEANTARLNTLDHAVRLIERAFEISVKVTPKPPRVLYRVVVNPGADDVWMDWNKEIGSELAERINAQVRKDHAWRVGASGNFLLASHTGEQALRAAENVAGGARAGAELLDRAGITGTRIPKSYQRRGPSAGAPYNYAVFNPLKVRIVNTLLFHPDGGDQASQTFGTDPEKPLVEQAKLYPSAADFRSAMEAIESEGLPGADVGDAVKAEWYQRMWDRAHPFIPLAAERATKDFLELLQAKNNAALWSWLREARKQENTGLLPPALAALVGKMSSGKMPADTSVQSALRAIRRDGRKFRAIYATMMGDAAMQQQLESEQGSAPVEGELGGIPMPEISAEESSPDVRQAAAADVEDPELAAEIRTGTLTEADLEKRETATLSDLAELRKNQQEKLTEARVKEVADAIRAKEKERRALQRVRAAKRKLAERITRPPGPSVDFEYKEMIRILGQQVDPHFRGEKTLYRREQSRAFFEANPEARAVLSEEEWKRIQSKSLNQWSMTELEDLAEQRKDLERLGKFKRGLLVRQEQRYRKDQRNLVQSTVLRGKEPTEAVGAAKPSSSFVRGLLSTIKPDRVMLLLDGGKPGVFTKMLDDYNRGWNQSERTQRKRREPIIELMDRLKVTPDRLSAKRLSGYTWLGQEIDIDGFRYGQGTWKGKAPTLQQVMFWYLGIENERTAAALTQGNNIPLEVIEKGIGMLSPEARELADAMGADMERSFPRLRQAFIERFNMDLPGEDHYVPHRRMEANYNERQTEVVADLVARNGLGKQFVARHPTFERIDVPDYWQTPIRTELFPLWLQSMEETEGFITLDLLVKRMHGILEDPDTRQAITQIHGTAVTRWLQVFTNNLARPDIYGNLTGLDRLQRTLRQNVVIAYLGFNLLSAAKNLTTILPYLADAGLPHLVSAAGQWLAGKATAVARGDILSNDLMRFVKDRSELVRNRSISAEFDLLKLSNGNLWNDINRKIGAAGMKLFEVIDITSITIGWKAVYDRALKENGGDEVAAAEAADKSTIRGQPSGRVQDVAEMYRGADVTRWFTMFTSALNSLWNIALVDVPLAVKNRQIMHAAGNLTAMILSGVAIAVASGALSEDDPEERKKRLRAGAWVQFVDMLPYVGSDISAMIQGRPTGQGVKFFPGIEGVASSVKAIQDGDIEKAVRGLSEGLLFGAGLPVTGPKRLLKALESGEVSDLMGWK